MSLIQNDIYNEYMYENNICPKCFNQITVGIENREDQMGSGYEYEIEKGHQTDCINYKKAL